MIHRQKKPPPATRAGKPDKYDAAARDRMMPAYLAGRQRAIKQVNAMPAGDQLFVSVLEGVRGIEALCVNAEATPWGRMSRLIAAAATTRKQFSRGLEGMPMRAAAIVTDMRVGHEARNRAATVSAVRAELKDVAQTLAQQSWDTLAPLRRLKLDVAQHKADLEPAQLAQAMQMHNDALHQLMFAASMTMLPSALSHDIMVADYMLGDIAGIAHSKSAMLEAAEHLHKLLWHDDQGSIISTDHAKRPDLVEAADINPALMDKTVMQIERLPLVNAARYTRARRRTSMSSGFKLHMPRVVNAAISGSTNRLFKKRIKTRTVGGSVLIDWSGSMRMDVEDVLRIADAAPAAHVAYYAGVNDHEWADHMGTLYITAEHGKRIPHTLTDLPRCGGGNAVDLWALAWLLEQPAPRLFVTDRGFTGPAASSAMSLCLAAERRGLVTVVANGSDIAGALAGRAA